MTKAGFCSNCGFTNAAEATICAECRHPLTEATVALTKLILCPNCGRPNPAGVAFCITCGTPLVTEPSQLSVPSPSYQVQRRWSFVPATLLASILLLAAVGLFWILSRPDAGQPSAQTVPDDTQAATEPLSTATSESSLPVPIVASEETATIAASDVFTNTAEVPADGTSATSEAVLPTTALVVVPDGIAIQSDEGGDNQIYIISLDGAERRQLTFGPGENMSPAVSPNGQRIAFSSTRDGPYEVYVMNRDGTGQTRLTFDEEPDLNPAWSPDGQQIAFYSVRNGQSDIFKIDSDGSRVTQITDTQDSEFDVSWSVKNRLAFDAYLDAEYQIYTSAADGSDPQQLTALRSHSLNPVWSPDGTQILFISERDSTHAAIYIMDATGGDVRMIHNNPGYETSLSWSPDGSRIVFGAVNLEGTPDIYLINADGTESIWLGAGAIPSWAAGTATAELSPANVAEVTTPDALSPAVTPAPPIDCEIAPYTLWASSLWEPNKEVLGCAVSEAIGTNAIYQYYDYGMALWREDTELIYTIYHNGTFAISSAEGPEDYFVSELLKGRFGYLWTNNATVRGQLGEPILAEGSAPNFVVQDFAGGMIFDFTVGAIMNRDALFYSSRTWTFAGE